MSQHTDIETPDRYTGAQQNPCLPQQEASRTPEVQTTEAQTPNARNPECQCTITPEIAWAGPAIALCHHSDAGEANEVREKLMDLMGDFAQNIDPNAMFSKTIIELSEDYRRQAAGNLHRLLNQEERIIININFMRNLSLAMQMLMCTMITQRNGETGGAGSE